MNSDEPDTDIAANPFSTRHTRPGQLPFLFEPGWDAARIVREFEQHRRRGAIVGPHGSGKSTLLSELLDEFVFVAGCNISYYVLRAGERKLRKWRLPQPDSQWYLKTVVLIDGYEQLSWWSRVRLKAACRWSRAGLLVTSHHDVRGLPTIYRTTSDLSVARALAQRLLENNSSRISDEHVIEAFEKSKGNVREMWFQLYDVYAQQMKSG